MPAEAPQGSLVLRALDAAMTASLRPRERLGAQLRRLVSPRSTGYDRVAAAVNALDRVLPGSARRATTLICRPLDLPFPAQRVELLAFGSGSTVFLALGEGAARVVKVYRRTLGASAYRLPKLLDYYRGQYDQACRVYAAAPGVVWPSEFLVIGGPILDRPAVACVQEFIGAGLRDFFSDFSEADARAALHAGDELRRQFLAFAAATLELARAESRLPDFLGRHNLAVTGDGAAARLHLIDYRIMPMAPEGARHRALRERQERCLQRIRTLVEALA